MYRTAAPDDTKQSFAHRLRRALNAYAEEMSRRETRMVADGPLGLGSVNRGAASYLAARS